MSKPIILLFLLFIIPFVIRSQSQDSIGTIYVKKKEKGTLSSGDVVLFTEIYTVVEQWAEYPGGGAAMNEFIKKNFIVPQEAFDKGISGTVFCQFLIDTDGTLKDIKVVRGVPNCAPCDAEALRVIKLMPKWIPARQGGRPVSLLMTIPVKFRFNSQ